MAGRQRIAESNRQRAQVRRQAQALAAARAAALAAYQAAVELYEATCQHPMADLRFKAALLQVQKRKVELAYERCVACGVAPAREGTGAP